MHVVHGFGEACANDQQHGSGINADAAVQYMKNRLFLLTDWTWAGIEAALSEHIHLADKPVEQWPALVTARQLRHPPPPLEQVLVKLFRVRRTMRRKYPGEVWEAARREILALGVVRP